MEMNLKEQIELWLEGVSTGHYGICGFNHDVRVEPTNGLWEPGESFRITFTHEEGNSECSDVILDSVIRDFRRVFNAKLGECPIKFDDDGLSAVVEDVRGFGRLHQ